MKPIHPFARQKGAALVIGLLLLTILTLLAITGMNTASTELAMAGNEQFRQNASQAAETGIEQAVSVVDTLLTLPGPPTVVGLTVIPGTPDRYTTSSQWQGTNTMVSGSGFGKFVEEHFQITSTGTSARNANATHVQGVYLVQPAP